MYERGTYIHTYIHTNIHTYIHTDMSAITTTTYNSTQLGRVTAVSYINWFQGDQTSSHALNHLLTLHIGAQCNPSTTTYYPLAPYLAPYPVPCPPPCLAPLPPSTQWLIYIRGLPSSFLLFVFPWGENIESLSVFLWQCNEEIFRGWEARRKEGRKEGRKIRGLESRKEGRKHN